MKRIGPVAVLVLSLLLPASTVADAGIDSLTNAYRASNGKPALTTDAVLTDLAAQRAFQIAQPGGWQHDYWWWDASGCTYIGENISYRVPASGDPAGYAVNQWINSPDHRHNMLGGWTLMGSAIYFAPDGGQYAAQLFGNDCARGTSAPAPKPVTPTNPTVTPRPQSAPQPTYNTPPPSDDPAPVVLPDTAMRSPCLTSRTLCPSLNRMTGTSFPF